MIRNDGIEISIEKSDGDATEFRLPLFEYLTADQVDQKQQEAIANNRFSQTDYVNPNIACDFHAFTGLIAFLLLNFACIIGTKRKIEQVLFSPVK